MTEAQIKYRLARLSAVAHIAEVLETEAGLSEEQAENLITWTAMTFNEIREDEEAAEKLRELAQEIYEELDESYTEGGE